VPVVLPEPPPELLPSAATVTAEERRSAVTLALAALAIVLGAGFVGYALSASASGSAVRHDAPVQVRVEPAAPRAAEPSPAAIPVFVPSALPEAPPITPDSLPEAKH
jgi:hypothetical protein